MEGKFKKKKSGKLSKPSKPKQPSQHKGYYCWICGEHKANEKFSGKGHAAHICKACAAKSPEQKSEDMTINRLHSMALRHLNESEINWLKNRHHDSRSEVNELARQVFELKFPRQARNETKRQLHINNIVLRIRGEAFDDCGDEYTVNAEFTADASGKIVKKLYDDNGALVEEQSVDIGVKAARKLFNVAVHKYDISFWDTDLCYEVSRNPDIDLLPEFLDDDDLGFNDLEDDELNFDDEPKRSDADDSNISDDRTPAWSTEITYKNKTEQNIKGYDYIPDPVMKLLDDLNFYLNSLNNFNLSPKQRIKPTRNS